MRGRKRRALERIDDYDFIHLAKTTGKARERMRFLAFAHIQEGKSYGEVASFIKVSYKTLMQWIKRFKQEGIQGLLDKPGQGNKPHLPLEQQDAFRKAVIKLREERQGGRIRGQDIAELLEKQFNIHCSIRSVYDTLKRVDLVWITGRSVHPKADLQRQEDFKKTSDSMY